jgi:putative transposase
MKENLWLTVVTYLAYCVDKDLWKAIEYLKEQVRVLKEQQEKDKRILLVNRQRTRLAAKAEQLTRELLEATTVLFTPEIIDLVIRFKEENPHWSYTRIRDFIVHLGYTVSETTVKNILLENGYDPEPDLTRKTTWKEFIKSHWDVLAACDFFSVEELVKGRLTHVRNAGRCLPFRHAEHA